MTMDLSAMVLLDPYVPLIDEVEKEVQETGRPSRELIVDAMIEAIPACITGSEREAAAQRAIEQGILRYWAEVEAPVQAILRARKASRPSAVRKVVAYSGDDAGAYRAALDGIEPDLSGVAGPPGVTFLALCVSWPHDAAASVAAAADVPRPPPSPPHAALRCFLGGAVIAGAHHNIIGLYYGPYRPCSLDGSTGFYLVYDALANSLAAVPPLPSSRSVSWFTHRDIGSGAAVLRDGPPSDYVLAELLLRTDHGHVSNNASLFTWWSSGPVAAAGRWIQNEVVLPSQAFTPTSTFSADIVFAHGRASICWVDLLMGILVCEDVSVIAEGGDDPKFRFISLPEGCSMEPDPVHGRGLPKEHRSMSCCSSVHGATSGGGGDETEIIKFLSMDGYGRHPINEVVLTTWTLHLADSEWKKGVALRVADLWADPTCDERLKLPPRCPVLSVLGDDVVYLYIADLELVREEHRHQLQSKGQFVLSVDMRHGKVLSVFEFPPDTAPLLLRHFVTSRFTMYLSK